MSDTLISRTATLLSAVLLSTTVAVAQEHRELDAHVHGVSTMEIAIEGDTLTMDLHAPGMDIVGFEHVASSDGDKDAVANAIATFTRPADLFALPDGAECRLTEVLAHLHDGEHEHEETDAHAAHEDHAHESEEHEGEEHAHEGEEHEGEDHAHESEGHEGEAHENEAHAHDGEQRHSEFHARYEFQCEHPDELQSIDLTAFFEVFGNAEEIEATAVTEAGASKAEVGRGDATLSLR